MSERLILVRHGETEHNVAGITQGWSDSTLSERGRRQVQRLAQRIATLGPTAIYASPLGRALSTAQAIADATRLEVQTHDDLREMNYGGWEGRSFLDVRREHEDVYQRWIVDGDVCCPGGESHADVRRRFERFWTAATLPPLSHAPEARSARPKAAAEPPQSIVVVSHGTAIRIAATALMQLPVMASRHFAQDNAAINIFIRRGDRWILKVWNDATHCGE